MSDEVTTTENTEVATKTLSPYELFMAKKKAKSVPLPVDEAFNKIASLDEEGAEEIAIAYLNVFESIKPRDPDDVWSPPRLQAGSYKIEKNTLLKDAVRKEGPEHIFNATTGKKIPADTPFFPLFAHTSRSWFGDGDERICASVDGIEGHRMKGEGAPYTLNCRTECPMYVDRYNQNAKGEEVESSNIKCKEAKVMYFTDADFSNIYITYLSSYSISSVYEMLKNLTRKGNESWDPNSSDATWFLMSVKEKKVTKGTHMQIFVQPTDSSISEAEAIAIDQLKLLVQSYYNNYKNDVDMRAANAASSVDITEEAETVEADDGSTHVTMPEM